MNQMAQGRHKPPDVTGLALIDCDPTLRHFGPPTYEKKSSEIKTYRIPGKARHPTQTNNIRGRNPRSELTAVTSSHQDFWRIQTTSTPI